MHYRQSWGNTIRKANKKQPDLKHMRTIDCLIGLDYKREIQAVVGRSKSTWFLGNNIQYTTMLDVILIIDCNYLSLICFYFASQWTGLATHPVYLLCPMYVYEICNIDINISCVVPFSSRLSHSSLFLYQFQCFTYDINIVDVFFTLLIRYLFDFQFLL